MISDRALAELLAQDTDHRASPDVRRRNSYGAPVDLVRGLLPLGACTASPPDATWWGAARDDAACVLALDPAGHSEAWGDLRDELARLIGVPCEIAFTGSGTDVGFLTTLLTLDQRRLAHLVFGAEETGSGTLPALSGQHFTDRPTWGPPVRKGETLAGFPSGEVSTCQIPVRSADGTPIPAETLSASASVEVQRALDSGARVVFHGLAASKTGIFGPYVESTVAFRARQKAGHLIGVVDAAQGRLPFSSVGKFLRNGWMVAFTASKFYGAPPFAGALIVPAGAGAALPRSAPEGLGQYLMRDLLPPDWGAFRDSLPAVTAPGLLLRWRVGMRMIRAWTGLGEAVQRELRAAFVRACGVFLRLPGIVPGAPAPRRGATAFGITSFGVVGHAGQRADAAALRRMHRTLAEEGFWLGQPVTHNNLELLRIALGVPLALRMLENARMNDPCGQRWLSVHLHTLAGRLHALASE